MTKREKKLLIIAIIIIISLFGTKEIILPTVERISHINEELQESEHQLEIIELELSSFNKYQNKLTNINLENSLYESFFYKGDPINVRLEILEFLNGIIKELDLAIESIEFTIERIMEDKNIFPDRQFLDSFSLADSVQSSSTQYGDLQNTQVDKNLDNGLYELLYRAQIRGSYQQLLSLLETVTDYEKYYGIRQVDIKRSSDNSQLAVLLLIESYCIKTAKDNQNEDLVTEDTNNEEQVITNTDGEEDLSKVLNKKDDQDVY